MTPERLQRIEEKLADDAYVGAVMAQELIDEIKRLQGLVAEWHSYDQTIKAALGGYRHCMATVPESIAAAVERASRYDDLCD